MPTADEMLAGAVEEQYILVDLNTRLLNIPKSITNIGVESDDDVLRLPFKMPRYLGKFDLSEFTVRVNYLNAKKLGDLFEPDDITVTEDGYITFTWLVGRHAAAYKGNVSFNVCLKKYDEADPEVVVKEFNSTIAILPILEGLETGEAVVAEYRDVLEAWKIELFDIYDNIKDAVDDYIASLSVSSVVSVNGKTGAVNLTHEDVGAAPDVLIDYTPYGGRKNFVNNLLHIDLQNREGLYNQSSVIATEDASTLINSPITTGAFYAYREVMFIDNPTGGLPKCVVRLTQAYPHGGGIWVNIYDPNYGYWIGWEHFKSSKNYVPAGYGWGSDLPCLEYQSADNANKTSVFYTTQGTPTSGSGTWLCEFYSTSTGGAYGHMAATCQDDGKQGCVCTRLKVDNVWQPWEWVNPPMWLGVEYRTTERVNGKAVYKKNVDGVVYYRLDGETEWKPYSKTVGGATVIHTTAWVEYNAWSSSAPYTATVAVNGVLASDTPIVDFASYGDLDSIRLQNFHCVDRIVAGDGTLTLYAYEEKPVIAGDYGFMMNVLIVR